MNDLGRRWVVAALTLVSFAASADVAPMDSAPAVADAVVAAVPAPEAGSITESPLPAESQPAAGDVSEPDDGQSAFATVDGTVITATNFDMQLFLAIREKFYHRRPPEEQLVDLRREVGDRMIDRILLLAEAKRRGLQPDPEKLRQSVAQFEDRNGANPNWQKQREQLLPRLEQELGEMDLLVQIEAIARATAEPTDEQLRKVYDDHSDVFTKPEQMRLSVILLKVDPGLPMADKEKKLEEVKALHARLVAGEDFAALAKEYSNDETAPNGGDMGFVHRGTIGENVYEHIKDLSPGAYTGPLVLMEGMAILRLDGRVAPQLKSLDEPESQARAAAIWKRESADRQWLQFKAELRKSATVEINDHTRYPKMESPVT